MSSRLERWAGTKPRRSLFNRTIKESDFPRIADEMMKDGLYFSIASEAQWFFGPYRIPPKEVKRVWGLHDSAYRRFIDWCLEHNPWGDSEWA